MFGTGTSEGRLAEARNRYCTASYLTIGGNGLEESQEELQGLRRRINPGARRKLDQILGDLSDLQLVVYGSYEITATRYDCISGRQGAHGVADPDLLETLADAPASCCVRGFVCTESKTSAIVWMLCFIGSLSLL